MQFFKYVLNIDVIAVIFGDITVPNLSPDVLKTPAPIAVIKEEVFNISNNLYSYQDAKAVCKAMGSRLATYDEIEDAYNFVNNQTENERNQISQLYQKIFLYWINPINDTFKLNPKKPLYVNNSGNSQGN